MRVLDLFESENVVTAFHGGGDFDMFNQEMARTPNDYYGGGVAYFTDSVRVAKQYARAAEKRSGVAVVYKVYIELGNVFDIDETFTGDELTRLLPKDLDTFARQAGLFPLGTDKYVVLAQLQSGRAELTGKTLFKGLAGVYSSKAREWLKKKGYDSLRYTGGLNMGTEIHNVWLPYYEQQINILGKKRLDKK